MDYEIYEGLESGLEGKRIVLVKTDVAADALRFAASHVFKCKVEKLDTVTLYVDPDNDEYASIDPFDDGIACVGVYRK